METFNSENRYYFMFVNGLKQNQANFNSQSNNAYAKHSQQFICTVNMNFKEVKCKMFYLISVGITNQELRKYRINLRFRFGVAHTYCV